MATPGSTFRPEQMGLFNQGGKELPVPEPSEEKNPEKPKVETEQTVVNDDEEDRYADLGGYTRQTYRDTKRQGGYKN